MKWIGALLLIGATTLTGFLLSVKYTERPKQIRMLIHCLQIIEAEMMYNQPPLNKLFFIVSEKVDEPFKHFLNRLATKLEQNVNDFYRLWEREVNDLMKRSSFKKSDINIINQFGKSLGQYNISEQQKQIQLTMNYLNQELEEAIDERDKYEKLTKSIGFLIGIFIVIIFI